ncbi:helix-turn-helix domain-containing protein [Bacillus toyonensis]|uniref:helix-turn-helix domain-containing protein n=1 Tax=Bacillus toyonensis TaxID=155322 RepID=UPI002E245797|nr:helix-turn-helix domain-containing protein [Bacillus toyonensis]
MGKLLKQIEQISKDIEQSTSSDNIKTYMSLVEISEKIEKQKSDILNKLTTEQKVELTLVKPNTEIETVTEIETNFLSVNDVSSILGVSPQMVRRYCQEGKLIAQQRFNGQWFIEEKQFSTELKLIPYWKKFCETEEARLKADKEMAITMLEILTEDDEEDE